MNPKAANNPQVSREQVSVSALGVTKVLSEKVKLTGYDIPPIRQPKNLSDQNKEKKFFGRKGSIDSLCR